jgi:hypothetical protein
MADDLSIRPVTQPDYDQWLPLWDGYNAFYGRSGETALPAEITRTTWSRFFDAYEPVHALVAERDGQLHETNRTARRLYDKVAENSGFVVYRKVF